MTFFFTTLVIASSSAGFAGTKVNKTKQVVEEKSSKEPQILNEKDEAKTWEAQKDIVTAGLFRGCWDTDPPGEHLEKLKQQLLHPALEIDPRFRQQRERERQRERQRERARLLQCCSVVCALFTKADLKCANVSTSPCVNGPILGLNAQQTAN